MPVISTTRARHRPIAAPTTMATGQQRHTERLDVSVDRQRDGRGQCHGHAGDAEGVPGPGCLVLGQPGQRQDEQQRSDEVGRLRGGFEREQG